MQDDSLHLRTELAATAGGSSEPTLTVRGDDTGATETLVYLDRERIARFSSWPRLVDTLRSAGLLKVDPAGVQFVLAYGMVPPPYSLYSNVFALGAGDRLEVDLVRGSARFDVDFPYLENRSRRDGRFESGTLKNLLVDAVRRSVPADGPALFMQSGGKDSTALLLSLAEAGRTELRAATYDPLYREREAGPAGELARRFGVEHHTVEADPRAEFVELLRFAEGAPIVCTDVALLAYLRTLKRCEVDGGVVIDGLGNDGYMGYVQPRRDQVLGALALARYIPSIWGRWEVPDLGARLSYAAKTAMMYPAERSLAGSRLSPGAVRDLVPFDTPFLRFFGDLDRKHRHLSPVDFRAYVRGRIFDGAGTLVKGRLASAHFGARAVHPFCDAALIDYCFHLPTEDRYDPRRRINKLAMRRLLADEIGDSRYLQEKGSVRYDVLRFVATNEVAIREELAAAGGLLRNLDRWAGFLLERKTNYVHAYALTTLVILAAWLVRRPADVVEPLVGGAGPPRGADVTVSV